MGLFVCLFLFFLVNKKMFSRSLFAENIRCFGLILTAAVSFTYIFLIFPLIFCVLTFEQKFKSDFVRFHTMSSEQFESYENEFENVARSIKRKINSQLPNYTGGEFEGGTNYVLLLTQVILITQHHSTNHTTHKNSLFQIFNLFSIIIILTFFSFKNRTKKVMYSPSGEGSRTCKRISSTNGDGSPQRPDGIQKQNDCKNPHIPRRTRQIFSRLGKRQCAVVHGVVGVYLFNSVSLSHDSVVSCFLTQFLCVCLFCVFFSSHDQPTNHQK